MIKQIKQNIKNIWYGIKIEELPAINGIQAERIYRGSRYQVIAAKQVKPSESFWNEEYQPFDLCLNSWDLARNTTHYFFHGLNVRNEVSKQPYKQEISPSDLKEFMPLVEALENRLGYTLIKQVPRERK